MTAALMLQLLLLEPAPREEDDEPWLYRAPLMLAGSGVVLAVGGVGVLVAAQPVAVRMGPPMPTPTVAIVGAMLTVVGAVIIAAAGIWALQRLGTSS